MERSRPIGITIIAILMIISGILFLIGGIGFVAFIPVLGSIIIAVGIASLAVAWGLLKGKGWAWIVTLIITGVSFILNAISIATGNIGSIVGIIINGIIIYYLYRPNVKSYFGRGRAASI